MSIPQDKVFLAMTRPSQFWGTHFGAIICNMVGSLYGFVFTNSLWVLAGAIPIHAVCVGISAYDVFGFRLVGLKLRTASETIGARLTWGASSRAPYCKRGF